MTQAELFNLVQQVHDQYGALFAEVITINFAMIVAIFYFLHRLPLVLRGAVYGFYLIGMITLSGLMLHAANVKALAIATMQAIAPAERSPVIAGYLALQDSWLFIAVGVFQNLSLWALVLAVTYMLFAWRHPDAQKAAAESAPR
jgi:hypothetical protein